MKAFKKIVSVTVAAAMTAGMFTIVPFTVAAAEGDNSVTGTVFDWVKGTQFIRDSSILYGYPRSDVFGNVILSRMNKEASEPNWDDVYNKTPNLTFDNEVYQLQSWFSGTWYEYGNISGDDLNYWFIDVSSRNGNDFKHSEVDWYAYTWTDNVTLTAHDANDATCTESGNRQYFTSADYNGMFFVEVETSDGPQYRRAAWDDIVIPAGHSFGDPEWDWDNNESNEAVATATFTCEECGEEQEETVTAVKISSTGEPGADVLVKEVWQASVGTCTDTLTRYWLPTNHAYSLPEWTWNADGATAVLNAEDGSDAIQIDISGAELKTEEFSADDYHGAYTEKTASVNVINDGAFQCSSNILYVADPATAKAKLVQNETENVTYFAFVRDAFVAAADQDTVVLLKDTVVPDDADDLELTDIYCILDLNGCCLVSAVDENNQKNRALVVRDASLSVVDNAGGGLVLPIIIDGEASVLELSGGAVEAGCSGSIINNSGYAWISNGTVNGALVLNGTGSYTISGGTFKTKPDDLWVEDGSMCTETQIEGEIWYVIQEIPQVEAYQSLVLDDEIVNKIYLVVPAATDLSDYTVEYTYNGETVTTGLTSYSSDSFKIAYCSAKDMTETAHLSVTYKGVEIKSDDYSIQGYCDYVLDNNYGDADLQALCQAILNYGASAQLFFNKEGDLPNVNHNEGWDPENIPESFIPSEYAPVATGSCDSASTVASLVLKSKTEMNFYVTPAEGVSSDTITVDVKELVSGAETDITDGNLSITVSSTGEQKVSIKGIAAKELDRTFVVRVSDGTNTRTLTASPMSYAYLAQNFGNSKLKTAMYYLYNYFTAAKTNFVSD